MNNPNELQPISFSFTDFAEDVQLCILSFLTPSEISTFACTSKRFASLCYDDPKLWFSMCDRRWGSYTLINKWGNGKISYKTLYKTLLVYQNLIGFWRCCGTSSSPLVFFEWGPCYIAGSRVSPSKGGGYEVLKAPFLWIGITSKGEMLNYLDPQGRIELKESGVYLDELNFTEIELIQVNVNFMGKSHVVVAENTSCSGRAQKEYEEIYQYFANWTSPSGNGTSARRDKEKKKWEPQHFVKIVNCSPTPMRPCNWKGICADRTLEFFLVSYDDIGGLACCRVAELYKPFSANAPVFWTSNIRFIESPLSSEEEDIYESRIHLQPLAEADHPCEIPPSSDNRVVHMLCMNSSYDLVIPGLAGNSVNPQQVEGRIWQYANRTFGFGFLRDNYIIDLRHIDQNGQILDTDLPND